MDKQAKIKSLEDKISALQTKIAGWQSKPLKPMSITPRMIKKFVTSLGVDKDFIAILDWSKVEFKLVTSNHPHHDGSTLEWCVYPKGSYGDQARAPHDEYMIGKAMFWEGERLYIEGQVSKGWSNVSPKGCQLEATIRMRN